MEWGVAYAPNMSRATVFPKSAFPHKREALLGCQRLCASVRGCTHFTMDLGSRQCSLSPVGSIPRYPVLEALSGPPRCVDVQWEQEPGSAIMPIFRKFPAVSRWVAARPGYLQAALA